MQLSDYEKLVDCRFVSSGGYIQSYWSAHDRAVYHDIEKVESELMKQLTCEFDFKNCVILFPLATQCGTTMLLNNREIIIDHCTYILDIADFLKSKGVTWKNGTKFKVDQCFPRTPMLVVNKGRAVICDSANPLFHKKIVGKKEIFFSGFLIYKMRNNLI